MKFKARKFALGMLLSLAMIVTMSPASVFAANGPCANGNACKDHVAAIGGDHYDTLNEAIKAAKTGDEIILLKDAKEVANIAKSNVTFTINLNNHAINTTGVDNYDVVKIKGSDLGLTIKNGKLLNSGKDAYGIYSYSQFKNLDLIIDNVTIDTGDQPIGVQGMNSNQNVTVKNSVINTNTTAIYFPPISGKLIVENTKINAVNNGIVVKGGTVQISGSTEITVTGTPSKQDGPYNGDPTGKGFPKTGNAVYVEGGYKVENATERPIAVEVLGGTFNSVNGEAIAVNHVRDPKTQGALLSGGEFSSDVSQFAKANTTAVALTNEKGTKYHLGTPEQIADKLSADAKTGDSIKVITGTVTLTNLPDGITVTKDDKAGNVSVNGNDLGKDPVITHTHKWGEPTWDWSSDNSKVTVKFACTDDSSHTYTETVTTTSKVTEATCEEAGKIEYTATVTFNGVVYSNLKTVTTSPKGHTLKHVSAKNATSTEKGWKEHWICEKCGKIYLDKEGTKLATEKDLYLEPVKAPKTGDEATILPFVALMLISGLSILLIRKRKEVK